MTRSALAIVGLVMSSITASLALEEVSLKSVSGKSPLAKKLMAHARRLDDQQVDISFLVDYEVKFQGCHHITQWNSEMDEDDDVRINTKRLVRFRLCPSNSCSSDKVTGCSAKYGDYVVDMNTFVATYLEARDDDCAEYKEVCAQDCDDDGGSCMTSCLASYSLSYCMNDGNDDGNANFDVQEYAACAQFNGIQNANRRKLNDENDEAYYIGPYCASQGGEIRFGIFNDDTCTSFSGCGEKCFYNNMGFVLPYADETIVSERCLSCGNGEEENAEVREVCENMYLMAGKCETKMNVDYPNESACTFIEGVKIIREDGVIRTKAVKKSKGAAVCIGLFTTAAVLLAAYVYYLRTKLGRARINLASSLGNLS